MKNDRSLSGFLLLGILLSMLFLAVQALLPGCAMQTHTHLDGTRTRQIAFGNAAAVAWCGPMPTPTATVARLGVPVMPPPQTVPVQPPIVPATVPGFDVVQGDATVGATIAAVGAIIAGLLVALLV